MSSPSTIDSSISLPLSASSTWRPSKVCTLHQPTYYCSLLLVLLFVGSKRFCVFVGSDDGREWKHGVGVSGLEWWWRWYCGFWWLSIDFVQIVWCVFFGKLCDLLLVWIRGWRWAWSSLITPCPTWQGLISSNESRFVSALQNNWFPSFLFFQSKNIYIEHYITSAWNRNRQLWKKCQLWSCPPTTSWLA